MLLNFNMLFQLVLTKFFKSELVLCLLKFLHMIKLCKEPFGFPNTVHWIVIYLVDSVPTFKQLGPDGQIGQSKKCQICLVSLFCGLIYCCSRGSLMFCSRSSLCPSPFSTATCKLQRWKKVPGYLPVFLILVIVVFFLNLIKENNSQLKKQLQNLEEALESTRQSAKNEEHKSNLLIAEKVKKKSAIFCCSFL